MSPILEDYLTREQLAAELNVTERTIFRWQSLPDGLPVTALGGRVLYRRASVRAWVEGRERRPNQRRGAR